MKLAKTFCGDVELEMRFGCKGRHYKWHIYLKLSASSADNYLLIRMKSLFPVFEPRSII